MARIPRTVWILSLTSLFTDLASEMLYPVLPAYLRSVGYSLLWIGILEGVAEFIVGLSKGYFGKESDRIGRRLPFIRTGYALSAVAKPLMAFSAYLGILFTARITDRLGKGIRTAARDAMLSEVAAGHGKGKIFGFHRGWDTAGAVAGPLFSLLFLHFYPGAYSNLFLIAFVPGLVSVLFLLRLKEKSRERKTDVKNRFFSYVKYYNHSPAAFRRLIAGLGIFALANSSDVFLLLKAGEVLKDDSMVIMAYLLYNLVYASTAYPAGLLADRFGMKTILLAGMFVFIVTYSGFAFCDTGWSLFALFGLYGIYAAGTQGVAKAWIAKLVPENESGTAMGFFAATQSTGILFASAITGWISQAAGYATAFCLSALLATAAVIWIISFSKKETAT